jgi:hypothetical protein
VAFVGALVAAACEVDARVADDATQGSDSASSSPPATTGTEGTDGSDDDSPASDGPDEGTTGPLADSTGSADDAPIFDVQSGETGEPLEECDGDEPDLIHVLNVASPYQEIWTFDPIAEIYDFVTAVNCPQIMSNQISGLAITREADILVLSYEPTIALPGGAQAMQLSRFREGDAECEVLYQGPLVGGTVGYDCADLSLVQVDGEERLFAHSCTGGGFTMAPELAAIFELELEADAAEPVFLHAQDYTSVPLAGTGDGRLFGVSGDQEVPGSTVFLEYSIDSGQVTATTAVPEIDIGDHGAYFSLAFYGGDLITFGYENEGGIVAHRYDWDDDDGNGEHEIMVLPGAADPPFEPSWLGVVAASSPTCIPLGPAG